MLPLQNNEDMLGYNGETTSQSIYQQCSKRKISEFKANILCLYYKGLCLVVNTIVL